MASSGPASASSGLQNWTSWGLRRAEYWGKTTSLYLVVALLLVQYNSGIQFRDTIPGLPVNIAGHVQPLTCQYTLVLLGWAALSLLITQSVSILGNDPTQIQDLTLGLLKLHEAYMGPPSLSCRS